MSVRVRINPLTGTLKSQSIGRTITQQYGDWYTTLADGWGVTFSTARRGLVGLRLRQAPS